MAKLTIGNKTISDDEIDAYVIAEIGVNYYEIAEKESLDLINAAKLMIKAAKEAGADAVKFQIYKADKLASRKAEAYWDLRANPVKSQYELFRKYDKLELEDYKELARYANSLGVDFIATPFDLDSAKFVAEYSPAIKVASADITNLPFLEEIAEYRKPIILSTGASNIAEIYEAVATIKKVHDKIALLHCILEYPTPYSHANLLMITHLKKVFPGHIVGYSDHTLPDKGMIVLTTAILLGARIIEKHFTLDKKLKGNDHFHSMDPNDLRMLRENINLLKQIMGSPFKEPLKEEEKARKYARRSIVAKTDLNVGDILTLDKIEIKRPGTGIPPKFLYLILNRKVKKPVKKDEPIRWEHIM